MVATLSFHGAARGVTGSLYHLQVGDAALTIDFGVFQGDRDSEERNRERIPFAVPDVVAAVFTHGHLDHVGRAPLLAPAGFRGEVLGHPATLEIAKIILADSAKINQHAEGEPLFGDDEVKAIVSRMKPIADYKKPYRVGPFTLELFDAGHILGSSSVRVSYRDGGAERAILFSGDVGIAGAPILRDPNTAWDPAAHGVDAVVIESTYGDRLHKPRSEVRANLKQIIERALADKGKVLIPAFSIGRTQEVLYELNALIEAGDLANIPVIVDGPLGLSATRIYRSYPECYDDAAMKLLDRGDKPFEFDTLINAQDASASKRAVNLDGPAIIIAGSGMCQGGRIRHHLKRHLPDKRTDILLVGYQSYRTLGRALQEGRDKVFLQGEEIPVRARITTISGLSAHADRDGLATWFDKLPRRDKTRVFVTHGEEDQAEAFGKLIADRYRCPVDVPAIHQSFELD
jgi:metallo-beta-lactamase family protein